MSHATAITFVGQLRRMLGAAEARAMPDRELLARFVNASDQAAFELIVWRHGGMVLDVCRRLLRQDCDVEDAFQATFLVLVRKAGSIHKGTALAGWLYRVAYRIAQRARVDAARRQRREDPWEEPDELPADPEFLEEPLSPVITEELSRLPAHYRDPLVLCCLEGRTNAEAAKALGCPAGTVYSRLARGREKLRARLARRGVTVSAGALAALLAGREATAGVSVALAQTATCAATAFAAGHIAAGVACARAASLAQGVLTTMWITQVQKAAALFLAAVLVFGSAGLASAHRSAAQGQLPASLAMLPRADSLEPFADKQKKELGPSVHGVVRSVDAGKNMIIITAHKEGTKQSEEKTLTLSADVRILLEDQLSKKEPASQGKLTDLSEGTLVHVQMSADGKLVARINARGPTLHANLKQADAAQNAVLITVKDKDAGTVNEQRFLLAEGAKVLLNDGLSKGTPDQEGKLADLQEGTAVLVHLNVRRDKALSVRVLGKGVFGVLRSHDAGNNTITIGVKEDGQLVDKTYTLAKDARIGNLTPGDLVNLRLSVFNKELVVSAEGRNKGSEEKQKPEEGDKGQKPKDGDKPQKAPDLSGVISAVSGDLRTITLSLPPLVKGDATRTAEIRITDKTKVTYFGVDAAGEQPTVGYSVQVWLAEGSQDTAAGLRLGRKDADAGKAPDLVGQISAVAKGLQSITIEVQPENKGDAPKQVEIKLTDKTKYSYFGVEEGGQVPTVGYAVHVWLTDGSKDTASGLRLGRKK
jgi:RNA polymerase sigma factor (sigma-70 family)